jgi:hypothetical protein
MSVSTLFWILPLPLGSLLPTHGIAADVFIVVVAGSLTLTLIMWSTITLWNEPRQLVPRHLRSERGTGDSPSMPPRP